MMKWFFILLLLLNAVYFGWELDRQTRMDVTDRSSLPTLPQQAERLQFLHELNTAPSLREVVPESPAPTVPESRDSMTTSSSSLEDYKASSEDDFVSELVDKIPDINLSAQQNSPVPGACFSFGPIADELQANGLHRWFTAHGGSAQLRHRDEQGRQLFWVYLSPQESRQEAMETIKSFREKGIRDFRLISKGNLQNAISMGLFSSQASVNTRLGELEKKGYKPVVVPYSDGKRAYWVDAELPQDDVVLGKVFNDYPSRFNSVPVKCAEIAIGSDYS
jgi:hypothetical protein